MKRISSKEFDKRFDKGKDISDYLDTSNAMSAKQFQEHLKRTKKRPLLEETRNPNDETLQALDELIRKDGETFNNSQELFKSLTSKNKK